ncbi:MAG: cytochrome c oxidase assembly factor Coa1 family protein [Mesorhizobium sp.]
MSREALNNPTELPRELDRWNWGAFFLNWIWGIGNSTPIALLALIPGLNVIMMIVLGMRGSRWAWRNRYWPDTAHFARTQRKWAIAGLVVWVLVIGGFAAMFVSIVPMMKNSAAYEMSMSLIQPDAKVREALGDDVKPGFWVWGGVSVQAGGTGSANLSIPLSGSKGAGTALVEAVRQNGDWKLLLVVVRIDGSDVPIVLVNTGNRQIPNAPVAL